MFIDIYQANQKTLLGITVKEIPPGFYGNWLVWEEQWIKLRIRRQNILLTKLEVMLLKVSD